jgi:hypothetical protein
VLFRGESVTGKSLLPPPNPAPKSVKPLQRLRVVLRYRGVCVAGIPTPIVISLRYTEALFSPGPLSSNHFFRGD